MKNADDRFTGLKPSELNDTEKQSVVMLAMKVLAIKHRAGRALSNPDETRDFLRLRLADYRNEVFGCLFLALFLFRVAIDYMIRSKLSE